MRVKVTQRHINTGRRNSPWSCPIAKAVRGATGRTASVGPSEFSVGKRTYRLPARSRRFIARFDWGSPVKPFTFRTLVGSK